MDRFEVAKRTAEIGKYLLQGLKDKEICKLLNITKQLLRHYKLKLKVKK
jgi:DNA-binding NarL/FixJ family response regulator